MADFRVLFKKDDVLIYISHLDLNHTFIRALNRADIKLRFSEGFNPHPKIVFALPLSIGMVGENELCDISVADESMTSEKLMSLLCAQMPPHIEIKKVYEADIKFREIESARYTIEISKTGILEALNKMLGGAIVVSKKTKGGIKNIDISQRIVSIDVSETDNKTVIKAVLCAKGENYLSPELLIGAMKDRDIISEDIPYTVVRNEIIFGKKA